MKNVKNRLKFVLLPALVLLLVMLAVPVSAQTGLPHNFSGTVKIGGVDAPIDTVISARFQDVEYGSVTTTDVGLYSYLLVTDLTDGDIIQFYVNDVDTTQTFPFGSGYTTEDFNLTVGEVPTQYTLDVDTVGSGSVTKDPDQVTYAADTVVELTAIADPDWSFSEWSGDLTGTTNPDSITMDGNKAVTAYFAPEGVTYDLTMAAEPEIGGTATDVTNTSPYEEGAEVSIKAVAEALYRFVNWTAPAGAFLDASEEETTFTMPGEAVTVTAYFAPEGVTYTLFVSSSDGGSVTTPGEGTFPGYDPGEEVSLLAVPLTGYQFVNWTGDVVGVNDAATTITMNDDEVVHANFVEVTGDLGDLVDETEPGGTLELPAGTYTGNVTIDKSITITGIEGETIIIGGIHVAPLVGSNVTIENLIITEYTDYGIWIELVDTDDVFTIRNNTIEGVEGSVIGIKVSEVVSGGSLTIRENAISGNEVGVKLLAAVADGGIEFNDITGNTIGLEQLAEVIGAYAGLNWWGDISGPGEENQNPGGIGDNVTGNIGYYPWLTRDFQTVLDDNIAYFGHPMVELNTGWNIISTPIALDPLVEWVDSDNISRTGVDTWGDYVALGDGLSTDNTSPVYSFDAENQAWVGLTSDDTLDPCDAIYVRMAEDDIAPILYSPDVSVPSKELYSGWNLVGLAWLPTSMDEAYGLPANEALVTVEEVSGGLTGYKLVVSPGVNDYEQSWIHIAGQTIELWTDSNVWPPPDGNMVITSGYWVFMLNDGTLAGFAFTPVSLPPMP